MKPRNRQRGVALVELAISMVVLIVITFGITEFGRAMYQYNTLAKAARDGARFLSTRDATDALAKTQAKCLVVYGHPACPVDSDALVSGLTVTNVSICDAASCPDHAAQTLGSLGPAINLVTVSIGGFTFKSLVSFVVPDIQFEPISVTMRQVL
jgi:TadE-like protein